MDESLTRVSAIVIELVTGGIGAIVIELVTGGIGAIVIELVTGAIGASVQMDEPNWLYTWFKDFKVQHLSQFDLK